MRHQKTPEKTISLIVPAPPSSVTEDSSSNNRHYRAVTTWRNFIDNTEMNLNMGIKSIYQDPYAILRMVQFISERLHLQQTAPTGVVSSSA